jgi:tetratricopeptide (TPR) repeat protein
MQKRYLAVLSALLMGAFSAGISAGPLVTHAGTTGQVPPMGAMEAALTKGRQAVARRDFAAADRQFQEAAAAAPGSPQPLLELAESARIRGQGDQSKAWLDKAMALAPRDVDVMRALARWHYASGQHAEAESRWKAALQVDRTHTGVLVDLADFEFNVRGDLDAAAALYEKALEANPSLPGARYALGIMDLRRNRLEPALRNLQEAARLSPGNALPWVGIAQVYRQRGDREKSLQAYGTAIKAQASYYPAHLERGELLLARNPAKALEDFEQAIRVQPRSAEARVGAGMALQILKQPGKALEQYQAAIVIDPTNVIALNNAAWLASERKELLDRALGWAVEAARLAPDRPEVQGTLAWVHHRRGDSAKALSLLQALIQASKKPRAESYFLLARVHADRAEKDAASAALREALKLDSNFPQAAEATALLRRLQGS